MHIGCRQFLFLTWKNLIVLRRYWYFSIFLLITPILGGLILAILRCTSPHPFKIPGMTYKPFNVLDNFEDIISTNNIIVLAPNISQMNYMSRMFKNTMSGDMYINYALQALITKDFIANLDDVNLQYLTAGRFLAGLEIQDGGSITTGEFLPSDVTFVFRMPMELKHPHKDHKFTTWRTDLQGVKGISMIESGQEVFTGFPDYLEEGWLGIFHILSEMVQNYIYLERKWTIDGKFDKEVYEENLEDDGGFIHISEVFMQGLPVDEQYHDPFLATLRLILHIYISCCFIVIVGYMVSVMAHEKETEIKYHLMTTGVLDIANLCAWCFIGLMISFITSLIILLFLKWIPICHIIILPWSSSCYLSLLLILLSINMLLFATMMQSFFTMALNATLTSVVFLSIGLLPYILFTHTCSLTSSAIPIIYALIFPNVAMAMALELILIAEHYDVTLALASLTNIRTLTSQPLYVPLVILLVQSAIFILCTIISELYSTWMISYTKKTSPRDSSGSGKSYKGDIQVPLGATESLIQFRNVSVAYKPHHVVLQDISIDIYSNEVTALMGLNGAGKTTFLSLLTGRLGLTRGKLFLWNKPIDNLQKCLNYVGYCPCKAVAFKWLTLHENLTLCATLKGYEVAKAMEEADFYLDFFGIRDHRDKIFKNVSRGVQILVAVAMAFTCQPKLVLLDDPTKDLDNAGKLKVWKLINLRKLSTTIVFVTHNMKEAAACADRLLILHNKRILHSGSYEYLSNRLNLCPTIVCELEENASPLHIMQYISASCETEVRIRSISGNILTLSSNELDMGNLRKIVAFLQYHKIELNLIWSEIKIPTIEDLFLRATATSFESTNIPLQSIFEYDVLVGSSLSCNRYLALFLKNFYFFKTRLFLYILLILAPSIILLSGLCFYLSHQMDFEASPLSLNIDSMPNAKIICTCENPDADVTNELSVRTFRNFQAIFKSSGRMTEVDFSSGKNLEEIFSDLILEDPMNKVNVICMFNLTLNDAKIFFNGYISHSAAICRGLLAQATATFLGKGNEVLVSPKFVFQPLTSGISQYLMDEDIEVGYFANDVAISLTLGLAIFCSCTLIKYSLEKRSMFKHYLLENGAGIFRYWFTSFVWDYVLYLIAIIIAIILLTIWCFVFMASISIIGKLLLLLLIFGVKWHTFIYLLAQFNMAPTLSYLLLLAININTGVIIPFGMNQDLISKWFDENPNARSNMATIQPLMFFLFPFYAFHEAVRNLVKENIRLVTCQQGYDKCKEYVTNGNMDNWDLHQRKYCLDSICSRASSCCDVTRRYFLLDLPGITTILILLILSAILDILMIVLWEANIFEDCCMCLRSKHHYDESNEDSDVQIIKSEVRKLNAFNILKHDIVAKDLTYWHRQKLILNGLNLYVNSGQIFALVGSNGSGLSTTVQLLISEKRMREGYAYILGSNIQSRPMEMWNLYGFTPNESVLKMNLTTTEFLSVVLMLRGYLQEDLKKITAKLCLKFGFKCKMRMNLWKLSHGYRQQFINCLALVGLPHILVFDSPFATLDIANRQRLIQVFAELKGIDGTIFFTTHSVDDAEISNNLCILHASNMKYYGSKEHLKEKFLNGVYIILNLSNLSAIDNNDAASSIHIFMKTYFPNANFISRSDSTIVYHVPRTYMPIENVENMIKLGVNILPIQKYSVITPTLEHLMYLTISTNAFDES